MPQTATLPASPALLPAEIVGLSFQNAGAGTLAAGVATFGQAFVRGDVPAGAGHLTARLGTGEVVPVQMDVKTRYEDGSVKFAVLSVERPEMAAGATLELALSAAGGGPAPAAAPVDMAAALSARSFAVDITTAAGATTTVDVFARLQQALADGTAQVWQSGPLAAQARVEVDMPGSQRLLFDVTVFQDGEFKVNALFNNDEAMGPTGGRVDFEAVVRMDGAEAFRKTVSQGQYQNWRETFSSDEANGGQLTGDPSGGWLNIRHDLPYLSESGAVARYDAKIGVQEALLQRWDDLRATTPGWGEPLANNNILKAMGSPGGREDIGITTAANSAWLMSQDARAARFALDQAEVSGAIPWNTWDGGNRTWLNTDDYPRLWTDPRGGTGRPGDPNSGGLTQQVPNDTGWSAQRSHQPDLSFVPYILTGERMHLDALQAQASFSIMHQWPFPREKDADLLAGNGNQLRSSAWSMRQVEHAAWASPDGSREQAYFREVAADNWKFLVSRIPEWKAAQGEAFGWVPGQDSVAGTITQFGQDYFASTTIMAAARGSADALTFLTEFQANYLIGRFLNADKGWNPRDGVAYQISVGPGGGTFSVGDGGQVTNAYKTWAEMGAATAARGLSNGTTGWDQSQGEYGRLGMASLAGVYHLTGNPDALRAYQAIAAESPPWTRPEFFALKPNYAITIEGLYGGSVRGTAGDDFAAPGSGAPGLDADLGEGFDTLHLGANGNTGAVRNVEQLLGSQADDTILLAAASGVGTVADLRGGFDRVTLADGGNLVTLSNVEGVVGGAGNDTVILASATATGTSIDLRGGDDRLVLSFGGANTLLVANAETVVGGAGNDVVTLLTPAAAGTVVDLGGGIDRLVLAANGNTLTARNVEAIQGGAGADDIAVATTMSAGSVVDLGQGDDTLRLADGGNVLRAVSVETIRGGAGRDDVTLGAASANLFADLGAGVDRLVLAGGLNIVTVQGVEELIGNGGGDSVTVAAPVAGMVVDLGGGFDRLVLADGANAATVRNTETVHGGDGDDTIFFGTAVAAATVIDLRGGADRVVLGNFANTARLQNVEAVAGGSGSDTVVLLTPVLDGQVDLGAGADRLEILGAGGPNRLVVRNAETILANGSDDTVTLASNVSGATVNLGAGVDRLVLAGGGANTLSVGNVETIQGGAGADSVTLTTVAAGVAVNLGGGADRLVLGQAGNNVTVSNVETVVGGNGNDAVALVTAAAGTSVSLGAGVDRLILGDFASNTVAVSGVEHIQGGAGADAVTLSGALPAGLVVALGAGTDALALSAAGGAVSIRDVERVQGGAGADVVTALTPLAAGSRIDLGAGNDRLVLSGPVGSVAIVLNAEEIVANGGADDIALGAAALNTLVNLGGGTDRLALFNATANTLRVAGVETVLGGTGNDTVTLVAASLSMTFDGGLGTDRLNLAAGNNAVSVRGVELVVGNGGADRVAVLDAGAARLEGGAGNDDLVGGGGNDVLVGGAGADRLAGGAGADHFLYAAGIAGQGGDTILDFDAAADRLVFEGMLRGAFQFRGANSFDGDGRNSEARFVEASRLLQVDANGDGVTDIALTLEGVSLAQLSAADFLWR